jgi:hypothetical protein
VRGTNLCTTHGGAAPQVRAKAALRLAIMMDPAPRGVHDHPDRFKVAKDILDRNKLLGTGIPEDTKPGHSLTSVPRSLKPM